MFHSEGTRKGSISFSWLLVINPIVILFYQNCSYVPPNEAQAYHHPEPQMHAIAPVSGANLVPTKDRFCLKGAECRSMASE